MNFFDYSIPSTSSIPAPFIHLELSDILDINKIEVLDLVDTGYDGSNTL